MADGTSQPSLNVFVAMMEGASNDPGFNFLALEPYDMYWGRVRDMYSPFESGMKSGSARVFEHQIPGGQYSNLYAQCKSMGLWDQWETILDTYRDVNALFGDVIKVTPSSKCVGDLALYLVNCKLTTKDLLDTDSPPQIDFPESVVGLMKGDLGFPHRGFPESVEKMILKGGEKRTKRAGLVLPPANFDENCRRLSEEWGVSISPEMGMSSLMYPKVFSDFMQARKKKGLLLRYLPTPVYFYAMKAGQKFTMCVPVALAAEVTKEEKGDKSGFEVVEVMLKRVGPLARKCRIVVFSINGSSEQHISVRDSTAGFEFDGLMADTSNTKHVASPMPGAVEKVLVKEGQTVEKGEVLFIVGAMKMEVKTSAPTAGKVGKLEVDVGTRVVEGALLTTIN
jgi:pyruvate carboxylase